MRLPPAGLLGAYSGWACLESNSTLSWLPLRRFFVVLHRHKGALQVDAIEAKNLPRMDTVGTSKC